MRIKLIKDYFSAKAGQVIECKDEDGQTLIKDGHTLYTDEMLAADKALVIEKFKEDNKMTIENEVKEVKKEITAPNVIVKTPKKGLVDAIKDLKSGKLNEIELRAPTGQDETDDADGKYLVYQGMDTLRGALMMDSVIWPKCQKITSFGPNEYGRFIPYRDESTVNTTSSPRIYAPGEGTAKTPSKQAFNRHDLKLGTDAVVVYLTDEILSDVNYIEQYVINSVKGKMGWQADYNILSGTYSAAVQGCIGVLDAGANNFRVAPVAHAATNTGVIVNDVIAGVDPRLRAGAEWYISNSMWSILVGQLGSGTTVSTQPLFSNNNMTLAGYPVNIMTQRVARNSAFDLLFGNFSAGYCVGEKGGIQMSVSKDLAFLTDEVVLRFTHRYLGAPTYRKYQGIDAMDVAAFSVTS